MNNGWGGDTSLRCLWGKGTDFSEDAITTNEPHQIAFVDLMGLCGRVLSPCSGRRRLLSALL